MIAIVPQMRVLLAVQPVDFRRGIDGLVAICRERLHAEPMSGALFIFASRKRRSIKILAYDGQGFILCQKRLSCGRFGWWPTDGSSTVCPLEPHQLQVLLWNGNPMEVKTAPQWRRLTPTA
jgi:transposase